ncbi:MAG TPA: efflux RND transporter periplasmic adaptor subunit [Steroidobacteraceae bacterium]|jgi:RND family efflux transporter MFP subunit|nr:efflux RND transporter periplasmic adaptor subunit [Steroidobacteraceae bacterium]
MTVDSDKTQLIHQLRIDRSEREDTGTAHGRWWLLAGIATAVIIAAAVLLLARNSAIEVSEATAVSASAGAAPAAILQATGYVTAERETTVSSQIAGQVSQVYVQEGEHVHRGQVLARLEDSAQRVALEQTRAQLAASQAQLRQYQVQLAQARRDFARDQALIGQHLVSEQNFETARTQVATLAAQVLTQQRAVAVAQAGVRAAQVQEDYTIVQAPFSGVVVDKAAQMGEMISPIFGGGGFEAAGIVTIVDMSSLEVDVDVNEAYIHRVKPGQPALAVLDAYPDWQIPAHVIAIVPTADKSKATVKVRVAFEKLDSRILPDMGVRVSFLEEASGQAGGPSGGSLPAGTVWVPASAVVQRDGHSVVFVVQGGEAHQASVTPGESRGDLRAVQGIANGAAVVRSPPPRLNDGARIAVKSDNG